MRGTYVEGLNSEDLFRLDVFEGSEYERQKVTVSLLPESMSADGQDTEASLPPRAASDADAEDSRQGTRMGTAEKVETETYIWTAGRAQLEETEWDFDEFVREKMWRWAGTVAPEINGDYEEVEEAVRRKEAGDCGNDPTRGRAIGGGFEGSVNGEPG